MGPLLAVVASDFQAITLTQDGTTALVSLDSDRGPIMLALPLAALRPLASRALELAGPPPARRAANIAEL